MPKIWEDGIVREMTQEEIEEQAALFPEELKESLEERLEKLERFLDKVKVFMGVKD